MVSTPRKGRRPVMRHLHVSLSLDVTGRAGLGLEKADLRRRTTAPTTGWMTREIEAPRPAVNRVK
jgi:hypothetical protein